VKRQTGSHTVLARIGWPDYVFAFHDREEIGPRMLAKEREIDWADVGGLVICERCRPAFACCSPRAAST
jgi:hypothetical protein